MGLHLRMEIEIRHRDLTVIKFRKRTSFLSVEEDYFWNTLPSVHFLSYI